LTVGCPRCGSANLPGDRFCGECGAVLAGPAPAPPGPAETPDWIGVAERRLVSVLFADLVGFTPFSEQHDPEAVREFLLGYFDLARQTIERFGGVVDKFIGDAVMAVWGAVSAEEDDAERAVRAALELVDAIGRRGVEIGVPDLAVRAGVLTGEAAVGPGGNEQGLVVGDLVNTASRLQSVAPSGCVVVGEATYRATRDAITFEALGEQALKGKAFPVSVWRAIAVASMRGGRLRAETLEPPFVGRTEELGMLKDAVHGVARERRSRLVSIVGIPGVGKTRLVWELQKYIDGLVEDIYWHQGSSPAYGEWVTFWALGEMVRGRAGVSAADGGDAARTKLAEMLDEYVPDAQDRRLLEPRLAGLLGLVEVPPGQRGELFAAFRTLFERVAERGTTVLVFEDLHWADAGLLDFIEEIPEWSRDHPILVITLARPEILERRPAWGTGRRSFLSLGPLSSEEMRRIVEGLVPGTPGSVAGLVLEKAAGVPLYAVELVRMLVDDGRLVERDGRFDLVGELEELSIPESLQAVIGARLDRLDSETRAVIQDAAVLGQTFTMEALAALRDGGVAGLGERLAELTRHELLELQRDPDSPQRGSYGFLESAVREVAYGRLTQLKRRDRHLRAARYFEGLGDDETAGIVAGHYLSARAAAGDGPEAEELMRLAVSALRAAAERAAALHSHEQVLSYCQVALASAPGEPDLPCLLELAARSAAALARLDEAEGLARRLGEWQREHHHPREALGAALLLGSILIDQGNASGAVGVLAPAVAGADADECGPEVAELSASLARAHLLSGDSAEALLIAEPTLVAAERLRLVPVIADTLITKGTALGDDGRYREGIALLQGALELAIEWELRTIELRARSNIAYLAWSEDPQLQAVTAEAGLDLACRIGERAWAIFMAQNLLDALLLMGDFDRALAVFDRIELAEAPLETRIQLELYLAGLQQHRKDPIAARQEVERLAAEVTTDTDPQRRSDYLVCRSEAAFLAGDYESAYALAEQAADNPFQIGDQALTAAGEAAIWLRDGDRLRHVLSSLRERRGAGRVLDAWRVEITAAVAAVAGNVAAAADGFAAAQRLWERLGAKWMSALNRAHFALLCPEHADAGAAADEARARAHGIGAPNLVALLDRALGVTAAR
jgi:class 3 adenylate cyclase/tetratricopeptide (TPR) repeat protein